MTRTRRATALFAALAALALTTVAGCTGSDDQPNTAATPQAEPSVSSSSDPAVPSSPATSASASATPSASGTTAATPTAALLDWKPLPGDPADTVTTNGISTLTIAGDGRSWSLERTRGGSSSGAGQSVPKGQRVMKAGLDDDYAVVVYGDEAATKGQTAIVTTLASGKQARLDAHSALPPAPDGPWSLDGSTLWRSTGGDAGQPYCLVSTDLASMRSQKSWCAGPRDGFANVLASGGRVSLMTFDDHRPTSCRTLATVTDATIQPYAGVPACKGIQAAALGGGSVWAMVPDEHRYQQVRVYAATARGTIDLGTGVNGTLTVCGGSAFWARNATGSAPAALMRWDGSTLTTAYESKGFLGQPLCAGDRINIAESGTARDRQLTAVVR